MTRQTTAVVETAPRVSAATLSALCILFFLSGISGLIYQVLWLRKLSLVFGVTIYAASAVLASFMAGLALGSYLAGRWVDRARRPLLWYAAAELSIGLSALATPAAFDAIERLYAFLYTLLPHSVALLTIARFLLSFIVLIIPTTLMGATLPIIIKSSLFRSEEVGRPVSILYGMNTAGAIVGALFAGFYLIGTAGILVSVLVAAAINLIVGLAALLLRSTTPDRTLEEENQTGAAAEQPASNRARKLVLAVFIISGFASLALEIVWLRVLVLSFDVTTYAFTIMLTAVLAGIAAGSFAVAPLMRRRLNWIKILAALEIAIALACLCSLILFTKAYSGTSPPSSFAMSDLTHMLGCSLLSIFPIYLLMGAAFPIGLRLWVSGAANNQSRAGERTGIFYSLNVAGAIIGSMVAGFVLLPLFGSRASLILIAAMILVSGLSLLLLLPKTNKRFVTIAVLSSVTLFTIAAASVPNPLTLLLQTRYPGEKILWHEEGLQTTASVHEGAGGARLMYLDGFPQADDLPVSKHIHSRIGILPLILRAGPKDVLVVGLGGGGTAGAVSQDSTARIDVVELSETVVRGAEWFRHVNNDALSRANMRVIVDDGRNYLMLTTKRYDCITADIIRPHQAGAGNLYSKEYFELARRAMKDDGLMAQWIGHGKETQYKLILRTFMSVFPNTTLWSNGRVLIGSKKPLDISAAGFQSMLDDPARRELLQLLEIGSYEDLLRLYNAGPEELAEFVGTGAVLTDDKPLAEYFLSLPAGDARVNLNEFKKKKRAE